MNIRVTHVYPPIPIRTSDYCATLDGYEPGDPMGFGATPADAVLELLDTIDWRNS